MDASTEAHLRALSRGQASSRQVREQTGLNYSEMLDALAGLGLRLPSFDYETADEEVQRGHDNFLAYLIAYKGPKESAAGKTSPPRPVMETQMNGDLTSRATLITQAKLGYDISQ